jgi:hypothetical protein
MSAIRLAVTMGALAVACAAPQPLRIVGLARAPGSECTFLADVSGTRENFMPNEDEVRQRAWRAAQDLGATHVLKTTYYRTGGYSAAWEGRAYRCDSAGAATAK